MTATDAQSGHQLRYTAPMRGVLIAMLMMASLGCPAKPPAPSGADAGTAPTLEVSAAIIDVGSAALRFGARAQRVGVVSIRARDLTTSLEVEVVAAAPACVGTTVLCVARTRLTLDPGVWQEVPVVLELSVVGEVRGEISFTPRSSGVPALSVTVLGIGTAAPDCLAVTPSTIDFGTLNAGCPVKQRPLAITNGCAVPRVVFDGEVTPQNTPFVLSSLTSLPRRLAPGESWAGLAEFLGGAPGLHEALLRFRVDVEVVAVGLQGLRSDSLPREFTFDVASRQLDVLVVLDSSPSFGPRRSAVERQVVADVTDPGWFAGPLRVGVLGTGGATLVPGGGQSFFENDQLDFATTVGAALAATDSNGDEVERCLDTAAQLAGSTSFWRAGSRRQAICITDAPEQSLDPLASVAILADAGVRWDVVGPPVSSPDGGCLVEDFDDGGHALFTGALDGSVTSICGSWRLPRMPPAPPPPTRFELVVAPNFPLSVWVDGALLPETDWSWEAATRTLVLRTAPLSRLVIRESASCPQ